MFLQHSHPVWERSLSLLERSFLFFRRSLSLFGRSFLLFGRSFPFQERLFVLLRRSSCFFGEAGEDLSRSPRLRLESPMVLERSQNRKERTVVRRRAWKAGWQPSLCLFLVCVVFHGRWLQRIGDPKPE